MGGILPCPIEGGNLGCSSPRSSGSSIRSLLAAILRTRVRGAEPGAGGRRPPWRGAAPRRGRSRQRQDDDAGGAGGLVDRARHEARADPAPHVQPAGRERDALARGTAHHEGRRGSRVGRHVPRGRQPAAPPPRAGARSHARLHGPRPGRRRRRDEPAPRRARLLVTGAPLPPEGHARRDLLADGQRRRAARPTS